MTLSVKYLLNDYTRLLLGGLHPLCGIGVTSMISVTSIPELWMERMADSLPLPGPFTYTFTFLRPASCAVLEQSSAATWAAYGVFFLEPLNPNFPAEDQEITSPFLLVREMMMLLKEALIWASPTESTMTLRFLVTFVFAFAMPIYYFVAFFLLATVLRFPFLVLELFFVR